MTNMVSENLGELNTIQRGNLPKLRNNLRSTARHRGSVREELASVPVRVLANLSSRYRARIRNVDEALVEELKYLGLPLAVLELNGHGNNSEEVENTTEVDGHMAATEQALQAILGKPWPSFPGRRQIRDEEKVRPLAENVKESLDKGRLKRAFSQLEKFPEVDPETRLRFGWLIKDSVIRSGQQALLQRNIPNFLSLFHRIMMSFDLKIQAANFTLDNKEIATFMESTEFKQALLADLISNLEDNAPYFQNYLDKAQSMGLITKREVYEDQRIQSIATKKIERKLRFFNMKKPSDYKATRVIVADSLMNYFLENYATSLRARFDIYSAPEGPRYYDVMVKILSKDESDGSI